MQIDEEKRQLISEINEFVKTLDENVREAAIKFLLGHWGADTVPLSAARAPGVASPVTAVADDRDISPQELIRQCNANSGMAKAEVLGYWLEVHQGKHSFSSGDLKEAFSQAREPAPRNASDVVAKLASAGKLMPAEKSGAVQYYRLTRTAIDEVRNWVEIQA